jgi:hypothetical protein
VVSRSTQEGQVKRLEGEAAFGHVKKRTFDDHIPAAQQVEACLTLPFDCHIDDVMALALVDIPRLNFLILRIEIRPAHVPGL